MDATDWLIQKPEQPLFPDLLWSRPENRRLAGKLLIIGGNLHGFSGPASAFSAAREAGVGTARVILPDATKKTIGTSFAEAIFAPSTPSGSFSKAALATLMEEAAWSDAVLLAGDFGRNSETAVALESFLLKYKGPLVAAGDGIDYFLHTNSLLLSRPETLSVINLGKLQKLAKNNRPQTPVLHTASLSEIVKILSTWTMASNIGFITRHSENLIMAWAGRVSTTIHQEDVLWQSILPAYAAVWWLQNPSKSFETVTTAVFDFIQ